MGCDQYDLAITLENLASNLGGDEGKNILRDALRADGSALEVFTRERIPGFGQTFGKAKETSSKTWVS